MKRISALLLAIALLSLGCNRKTASTSDGVASSTSNSATGSNVESEVGFEQLFNGRDLTGWVADGEADSFSVENGAIKAAAIPGKRQRNWLFTTKQFNDIELRVDFKLTKGANSGVSPHGKVGFGGGNKLQLHVKVRDDASLDAAHATGTVAYMGLEPITATKKAPLKPIGEWNTLRIVARGHLLTAWVNGELVNEQDLAKAATGALSAPTKEQVDWGRANLMRTSGPVGLQVMVQPATYYRNIRVKPLSP